MVVFLSLFVLITPTVLFLTAAEQQTNVLRELAVRACFGCGFFFPCSG